MINNTKVEKFDRKSLSRKVFIRSKKGKYRVGDVLRVPRVNIVNRKGRKFEKVLLRDHYYVVTSDTEKANHNIEMVLLDGMYSDRCLYPGQVFLPKECGLKVDSVAKADSIILADREDLYMKGAYIYTVLPEDVVSKIRQQMSCTRSFENTANIPRREKGERLYVRHDIFDYEEELWKIGLFVGDGRNAKNVAEELKSILGTEDIRGYSSGRAQVIVADPEVLDRAADLISGEKSFVFVRMA